MKKVQLRRKAETDTYQFWSVWVQRGRWPFRYWGYVGGSCDESATRALYDRVCAYELDGDHLIIEERSPPTPSGCQEGSK